METRGGKESRSLKTKLDMGRKNGKAQMAGGNPQGGTKQTIKKTTK